MDLEEKILKMLATELARAEADSNELEEELSGVDAVVELFDILAA